MDILRSIILLFMHVVVILSLTLEFIPTFLPRSVRSLPLRIVLIMLRLISRGQLEYNFFGILEHLRFLLFRPAFSGMRMRRG